MNRRILGSWLPAHRSAIARFLALTLVLPLFFISCDENMGLVAVDEEREVLVEVVLVRGEDFAKTEASQRIHRIRLQVREAGSGREVLTEEVPVDPGNPEPNLRFRVERDEGGNLALEGSLELIHRSGSGPSAVTPETAASSGTVEWAARFGPTSPPPGVLEWRIEVEVGRGTLEEQDITGLTIEGGEAPLLEGGALVLQARVEGGPEWARVFWWSEDPSRATVDESGRVSAHLPGAVRIMAAAGPRTSSVELQVLQRVEELLVSPEETRLTALGAETVLTARVLDPRGEEVVDRTPEWGTDGSGVVEHLGDGRFRANAVGETEVVVTVGGVEGRARLVVEQEVAVVTVDPESVQLTALGVTALFQATARDANGHEIPADPGAFEWESLDPEVATVDDAGVVTAVSPGEAAITTNLDGRLAQATVIVRQRATFVQLQPITVELTQLGDATTLQASAQDLNGREIVTEASDFAWTTSDATVATVEGTGEVTATGPGEAVITASLDGTSADSRVIVGTPRESSVTLTPSDLAFAVGQTQTLVATATDEGGNVIATVPEDYVWASSATAVVTVDAGGTVTAVGAGKATVTATLDGVSGVTEVTVTEQRISSNLLHYELEDCSGDRVVNQAGGISGTIFGAFQWLTPGAPQTENACALRVADNGGVDPGFQFEVEGDFTIDFFWRFHSGNQLAYMWNDEDVSSGNTFRAFTNGNAGSGITVRLPWSADIFASHVNIQDGNWHNIRLVMDTKAGTSTLYLNGQQIGQSGYGGQGFVSDPTRFRAMGRSTGTTSTIDYDRYIWSPEALHPGGQVAAQLIQGMALPNHELKPAGTADDRIPPPSH